MSDENQITPITDDRKGRSTMRFMCVFSLFISIGFGGLTLWLASGSLLIAAEYAFIFAFAFLISAFGGKIGQKFFETNPDFLKRKL